MRHQRFHTLKTSRFSDRTSEKNNTQHRGYQNTYNLWFIEYRMCVSPVSWGNFPCSACDLDRQMVFKCIGGGVLLMRIHRIVSSTKATGLCTGDCSRPHDFERFSVLIICYLFFVFFFTQILYYILCCLDRFFSRFFFRANN